MNFQFGNKQITGILTVLPQQEIRFEDEMEMYNFSASKSLKLKLVMGYDKRRVVSDDVCVSDLCVAGLEHLFEAGKLKKEDIGALVLVTQSPDHFMPPTSNIIQGRLGLGQDVMCLDINQGCAGFVIGLFQSFMLLELSNMKKVVLLNADVLSRKVSRRDRNSNPLIGDGATITIVEKSKKAGLIFGNIKMDGTGASALTIPAGGFRIPSTAETAIMEEDANGNFRSKDNLVMKGDEVFNFVQTEVPGMIAGLLHDAGLTTTEVDYFMFHQPNKFMLQKLADKMGVPHEKMPNNIVEHYGNGSGITIPLAITHNLAQGIVEKEQLLCMAGFGVGLTWAAMVAKVGPLDFCEMIDL